MALTKATYSMIDGATAFVDDFGAVPDNATDCTSAIQNAVDSNLIVKFGNGTYYCAGTITLPDGAKLVGGESTTIRARWVTPASGGGYSNRLFTSTGVGNSITLENLTIDGSRAGYDASTDSENCIKIRDASYVEFKNVTITKVASNFGGSDFSNVSIRNCDRVVLDGLSMIDNKVEGFHVIGESSSGSSTVVEVTNFYANTDNYTSLTVFYADRCLIRNANVYQTGNGSRFNLLATELYVSDCYVSGNAPTSANGFGIENEAGSKLWPQKIQQFNNITFDDCLIGISCEPRWQYQEIIENLIITNISCINMSTCVQIGYVDRAEIANVVGDCATVVVAQVSSTTTPATGAVSRGPNNISISDVNADCARGILNLFSHDASGVTWQIEAINISDSIFSANRPITATADYIANAGATIKDFSMSNCRIIDSKTDTVTNPVNIPRVTELFSMENIYMADWEYNWTIDTTSADIILDTVLANYLTVSKPTGPLTFTTASGKVSVQNCMIMGSTGALLVQFNSSTNTSFNISSNSPARLVSGLDQTAVPTTGTWQQGDIIWNTSPSAGGVIGWSCVTGGTPGTWKSFGTIAT